MAALADLSFERKLTDDMTGFYADPLGFVMYAYPWGVRGTLLEHETGPDKWQREHLESLRHAIEENPFNAIRESSASGHGIGKTTGVGWIIDWAMSTRPHLNGVITANTMPQLRTKTWRELAYWHKLSINRHWFKWTATKFAHVDHDEDWFCSAITNSEENSESFAGTHGKYMLMIYDEASAIPDAIWEVSEGATTTDRSIWLVYGNPTRNIGRFKTCFTTDSARWTTRKIDARTSKLTNKKTIEEWRVAYGEDSDFFKVRVLGEFPTLSSMQLIPEDKVEQAAARELPFEAYGTLPLVMGIDVARGGDEDLGGGDYGGDDNVIVFRRGRKIEETIVFPGRGDTVKVAIRIRKEIDKHRPQAVYCDVVGNAAGVVDNLRNWGYDVVGVNSHTLPDDEDIYYDKRIEMWARMAEWVNTADMPEDRQLKEELVAAQFGHTKLQKRGMVLMLEKKKHIMATLGRSPDRADALAHTFYYKLAGGHTPAVVGEVFGGSESVEPEEAWAA